ncbi:MAG: 30S ribosomal protein S8 [Acidobacteria bacterium]|nr:30S ribosomal protein S8 [Acidobacteriota bacterium]NIM60804.1 30S ribosomal protein S8 [Acidobacteriota bacterium]NIQ83489.1 30S ribosomal protein S8 [Acidobacteriota bacterium]NIT09730.1 30S ribosomal protein S8 [Acidobacteriota bacterium]
MSMTDPISDLLTQIRNAASAKHSEVRVPASRIKTEVVKILAAEGYIDDFAIEKDGPQGSILITLKYVNSGERAITGLQRVSRPGRRIYCGKDEIPKVLNGLGITIMSTSKGVMTGSACRRLGIGGEVLCNVW